MSQQYFLTCISVHSNHRELLSDLDEASRLSNLHVEMIETFLQGSLVKGFSDEHGNIYFDQAGISRLRQIAHLRQDKHINFHTIRYITKLLDELDARDQELHILREQNR
jgi:DNA-binding transcriptional MerR regulator